MKYVDILERDVLRCSDCPHNIGCICDKLSIGGKNVANITRDVIDCDGRLKECPIVPLPAKQVCNYYNFETYANGVAKGWNDCIDKITGEGSWR